MKFGLKVHHTDFNTILELKPEGLEFMTNEDDLSGFWVDKVLFKGPIVVHAPEKYLDGSLIDISANVEPERVRAVDTIKRSIDVAVMLGAGKLVYHPGGVFKEPQSIDQSGLIRSIKELKEHANRKIDLLIENMPDFYWYGEELWSANIFKDWKEIRNILHSTDSGMCFDICHARLYCNSKSIDFISYVRVLKPYIRHIHISDALGISGEGIQIGEGETNFRELLNVIGDLDVMLVPEIQNGYKNNGLGFKVARNRLARLGYIRMDEA